VPRNAATKYEEHRQAAIRAAASVFVEKGFHGSSTRDIADKLGIKQASLYYYFDSKQEALSEVCLYGIQDYVKHMTDIAVSDQSFEEKIQATVSSHLSSYRERSEALKVYNDERLYLSSAKRQRLKTLGSKYREKLESIFSDAKQQGVVREAVDPNFAAQAVIGLCNSFGDLIVRNPDRELPEIIRKCVDLLINGFVVNVNDKKIEKVRKA
jgi:AcrR family transcriptional regulator